MKEIISLVEKYKQLILDAERYIWNNPETGYKEFKTSAYMKNVFESLGYELILAEGITGFYTIFDTGRPGPEILILAELDSVICPEHKEADRQTGAVHSCGHNAQCAALIGIAAALKESEFSNNLYGKIRLCAVPAEELLEIEYRSELKKQGKIKYFGGKTEFLSRGYFDGVDMAFMIHTAESFSVRKGSVGCVTKEIIYKGVAAHAGGAPWDGKNALYAANCGLNAINSIRETFNENDKIRVHPIITSGGNMVNAIPETVTLESYVRGASFEAIKRANQKVNQALCGSALSLGTNIEIIDKPGYAPLLNDENMIDLVSEAAKRIIPEYEFCINYYIGTGSTDMGDLSCLMPVVHPYAGGASGIEHGHNYQISDPISACIASAKLQLEMLYLLLKENAQKAIKIINDYKPQFKNKEEYFELLDSFYSSGNRIKYRDDNTAEISIF